MADMTATQRIEKARAVWGKISTGHDFAAATPEERQQIRSDWESLMVKPYVEQAKTERIQAQPVRLPGGQTPEQAPASLGPVPKSPNVIQYLKPQVQYMQDPATAKPAPIKPTLSPAMNAMGVGLAGSMVNSIKRMGTVEGVMPEGSLRTPQGMAEQTLAGITQMGADVLPFMLTGMGGLGPVAGGAVMSGVPSALREGARDNPLNQKIANVATDTASGAFAGRVARAIPGNTINPLIGRNLTQQIGQDALAYLGKGQMPDVQGSAGNFILSTAIDALTPGNTPTAKSLLEPAGMDSQRGSIKLPFDSIPGMSKKPADDGAPAPWRLTKSQFSEFVPPSPLQDSSRSVGSLAQLRADSGTLADYANDPYTLGELLGKGYGKANDVSALAPRIKAGMPIKVYRATDAEGEIFPGAYVTPSKNYANEHAMLEPDHSKFKILEVIAHPDELIAMGNPNEFFYAPRDVDAYHRSSVEAALKSGKPVPTEVLADYPDLLAKRAPKGSLKSSQRGSAFNDATSFGGVFRRHNDAGGNGMPDSVTPETPVVKQPWEMSKGEFDALEPGYHVTSNHGAIVNEGFKAGKGAGVGGGSDRIWVSRDEAASRELADFLNGARSALLSDNPVKAAGEFANINKDIYDQALAPMIRLQEGRMGRPLTEVERAAFIAFKGSRGQFGGGTVPVKYGDDLDRFLRSSPFSVIATRGVGGEAKGAGFGGQYAYSDDSVFHGDHKQAVAKALADGLPVPPEVLAEYPDLKPVTAADAGPMPANPAIEQPKPVDRADAAHINGKTWYHGTGTMGLTADSVDPGMTDIGGLFGPGLYLTDAPPMAAGYARSRSKKTGTPAIYEASTNIGKALDLEKPIPADVTQILINAVPEDYREAVHVAAQKPGATVQDVYRGMQDDLSTYSHDAGISKAEITDHFQDIGYNLKRAGYDAYTHTGGLRTGNDPHQVVILIDPNDQHGIGRGNQVTRFEYNPTLTNEQIAALPQPAAAGAGGVPPRPPVTAQPAAAPMPEPAKNLSDALIGNAVAEAKGETLAPLPRGAEGIPSDPNFQLANRNVDEGGQRVMAETAKAYEDHIQDRKRGVISTDETTRMAELLGMTEKQLQARQKGQAFNAEQLKAASVIAEKSAADAKVRADELAAKRENGTLTDAERLAFLEQVQNHAMNQAEFSGATAEVARALQILKKARSAQTNAKFIKQAIDKFGGPDHVDDLISVIANTPPEDIPRALNKVNDPTFLELLSGLRKSALMSGPKTAEKNVLSTMGNVAIQQEIGQAIAGTLDWAYSGITGKDRVTHGTSITAMARAGREAMTKGVAEAKSILKTGSSLDAMDKLDAPRELRVSKSPVVNAIVNMPFRVAGAGDAIMKAYVNRRWLEGAARVAAVNEVRAGKLDRSKLAARTLELAENPTPAMTVEAIAEADRQTFNEANLLADKITAFTQAGRNTRTGQAINFAKDQILPFLKVPINYYNSQVLEPTGLMPLYRAITSDRAANTVKAGSLKKALQVIKAPLTDTERKAVERAIGLGAVGAAQILLGQYLAAHGSATGISFTDPGDKGRSDVAGIPRGAIKVGNTWHSVSWLFPLVTMGASFHEAGNASNDPLKNFAKKLATGGAIVLEQPFLSGAKGLIDATKNPASAGERWLGSQTGSYVPTLLSDVASVMDDKKRTASGPVEGVMARVPGLRNMLPAKTDPFGTPIPQDPTHAINPFFSKSDNTDDPLTAELVRLGVDVSYPKDTINVPQRDGSDPVPYKMKDQQQNNFRKAAGDLANQAIERYMALPIYQELPDDQKKEAIEHIIAKTRSGVTKRVKAQLMTAN